MMQTVIIVVFSQLLIMAIGLNIWLGINYFQQRRKRKRLAEYIKTTWEKQQYLYKEVLRKRLAALYGVEGEALAVMMDEIAARDYSLIQHFMKCLVFPEPMQLSELLQLVIRHGEVSSQLVSK